MQTSVYPVSLDPDEGKYFSLFWAQTFEQPLCRSFFFEAPLYAFTCEMLIRQVVASAMFRAVLTYGRGEILLIFSYQSRNKFNRRGGRSSNKIKPLTKHYYLTKWRPQIKRPRPFNDCLPLFHVHVWHWLSLQFFLLFARAPSRSCLVILLFYITCL